jgi:7-keto-8-aminopelargonate synthetase-like enzyme
LLQLGREARARAAARRLRDSGVLLNQIEYPAVALRKARLRMQLQSSHTHEDLVAAARRVVAAIDPE